MTQMEEDLISKLTRDQRAPKASALGQPRGMGWGGRWEEGSGYGDICVPVANPCQCMAKTTTIL